MGVKIQVARCGRCGKPRGLTHTCVTLATSTRKPGRTRLAPRATVTCRTCGKPRGLAHTCTVRTDYGQRKAAEARRQAADRKRATRQQAAAKRKAAAQARRQKAAAAAAKRRAAADRKRKAAADRAERRKAATALRKGNTVPSSRPRSGQHDFRACRDTHCERFACLTWKEALREGYDNGYDKGYETGYQAGYNAGFPDGQAACPLPHGG
jgi:hypothetical protein